VPLVTLFPTENGIERLLAQPNDVVRRNPALRGVREATAPSLLRKLFGDYVNDLGLACDLAAEWWEGTVEAQEDLGLSRDEAVREAFDARLAGPASNPHVVWIVRAYWLLCEAENRASPSGHLVYPEEFLLQWLIDSGEDELVALIACMPYWPIGLDENGNWC
jgi:hypothetical protein